MLSYLETGFYLLILISILLFGIGFLSFGITKEDREDLKKNKPQLSSASPTVETSTQEATT